MCRFCVLIGGFQGSCCGIFAVLSGDVCPALPAIFRAAGGMSFRFSANIGLMCGYLLLFHDSFIIFHVKNNAVQHAYYYHNTFAPHCFCGLTGREVFCAVMGVSRRFLVCLGVPGFAAEIISYLFSVLSNHPEFHWTISLPLWRNNDNLCRRI